VKINYKIVIYAICSITVLEIIALLKGIDGIILSTVIAAIAGLAGWVSPQLKLKGGE